MVWVVALKLVAASVEESLLLLPILEKEENENGGADGLLPLWRKKDELSVERDKCGGEGGLESLRARWTESVERKTCCRKKSGEDAGFFRLLDPIFSSLRSSIEHGGRG